MSYRLIDKRRDVFIVLCSVLCSNIVKYPFVGKEEGNFKEIRKVLKWIKLEGCVVDRLSAAC
jgi:hypothetical protein